jgi:hypothetical protein
MDAIRAHSLFHDSSRFLPRRIGTDLTRTRYIPSLRKCGGAFAVQFNRQAAAKAFKTMPTVIHNEIILGGQ